jgi:hypothetical protein
MADGLLGPAPLVDGDTEIIERAGIGRTTAQDTAVGLFRLLELPGSVQAGRLGQRLVRAARCGSLRHQVSPLSLTAAKFCVPESPQVNRRNLICLPNDDGVDGDVRRIGQLC